MPLISLRQMLDHAAENDYAVPAFNVNNMEQIQAIVQAAEECDAPAVCLQAIRSIKVLPLAALARRYARHDAPLRRAA